MNKRFGGSDNDFVVERSPHLSDTVTCQFTQRTVIECVGGDHADQDPARDGLNCQSSHWVDLRPTLGDYSGPLKIRRELGALSPSSAGVSRVIQTLCWHNSDKRIILTHSSKGDTDNTRHELCSMYSTTNCTLVRSNLPVSEYRMYAVSGCWEETTFNECTVGAPQHLSHLPVVFSLYRCLPVRRNDTLSSMFRLHHGPCHHPSLSLLRNLDPLRYTKGEFPS